MKNKHESNALCPRCGQHYQGFPALSRVDNKTHICPDCSTREALESINVEPAEQEAILRIIHQRMAHISLEK